MNARTVMRVASLLAALSCMPVRAQDATTAGSADEVMMTPAELAALGLDANTPALDRDLKLSGFADAGFGTLLVSDDSYWRASGTSAPRSSFFVGNFNLYVTKALTSYLRTMGEVRFSFLPNGSTAFGAQTRQSTLAYDYTDFGRATRWGGIIIQRLYIEVSPFDWLTVRLGQYLTPYGVWNVDHGSPVVIPVRRPWSISAGWIPERQTGLELYGRLDRDASSFGYHLTLSNGTGPVTEYADLDENKALGGRLYWEYRGIVGWWRLGASAYWGRDTDANFSPAFGSGNKIGSSEVLASQYDALTFAGDLTWDLHDLHVQTEWIVNQRAYTDKGRAQIIGLAGGTLLPSDQVSWGGYVLAGYRLPWFGIMPFFLYERAIGEQATNRINMYSLQWGLNVRPLEDVVLKLAYEYVVFVWPKTDDRHGILAQVAWAF